MMIAAAIFSCAGSAWAAPSPNILFVILDDMAWGGSSVQMDPNDPLSKSDYHQTPQLERLAQQGMVFTNSYGAGPMCSPSRVAIMSGKSPAQMQVTDVRHAGNYRELQFQTFYQGYPLTPPPTRNHFPQETTIVEAIRQSKPNYKAGYFGKYDWQPNMPFEGFESYNDLVTWTHTPEDPIAMFTVTNNAMTHMEQSVNANRPFITYVSHDATKWDQHSTLRSRAETRAYFQSLPPGQRHNNPAFAAMYKDVDTTIGLLLDKIDQLGIADNTYVIFTSDQGASADLGNSQVNGPLFEGKGSLYEGGIRTPLIVRGPGVAAGAYSDVKVTSTDLYSTFLDLAGRTLPLPAGVEGVSLKPILTNGGSLPAGQTSLQRPFGPNGELFFHYPHYTGFLVETGGGNYQINPISPLNATPTPASAIIDGDFKLIRFYGQSGNPDKFLLFNLAQNQMESADFNSPLNLASQFPEKVEAMRVKLNDWLQGVDASLPYDVSAPVDLIWNAGTPGTTLLPNSAGRVWRSNDVDSLSREEWYAYGSRTETLTGVPPTSPAVTPARVAANPHQPGLPRHSFDFDGNDGFSHLYFNVSDAKRPGLIDGDHSATFETWVRFDGLSANQLLFESGSAAQGLSLTVGDADGDTVAGELRFRVLGKAGNHLTVTAELDKFADPTSEYIHLAAVVSDSPTNRFVELYVNGALMGRTNGTPGPASLDWDGYDAASLGRLSTGEFYNVDSVGAASGSGLLPFTNGNLKGNVSTFRFQNTALSADGVRGHYNAALYPVSLGIVAVSGEVATPAERPSNVSAGAFESAGVRIMQERNGVLASPLAIDTVVTGAMTLSSPSAGTLPELASGVDFTNYLLHFDPVGSVAGELRTVAGSVTFAEKIIGLATSDAVLSATDPRLGAIGNYGESLRGITWSAGDFLTVSSDQLTLSFQLSAPSDQLMQLRVITDSTTLVPPIPLSGDFNGDGTVNAADLAVWQTAAAQGTNGADADGDGDSDGADFLTWQRNLGATTPPPAAAVPEAGSLTLISLGLSWLLAASRLARGRRRSAAV